jgi:hypothetical protein
MVFGALCLPQNGSLLAVDVHAEASMATTTAKTLRGPAGTVHLARGTGMTACAKTFS